MKTKKHLFFDMDHTITPARQPIQPKMLELLTNLLQDIIIVSGSKVEQMNTQIPGLDCAKLGQNGNEAYDFDGQELWKNSLTDSEKEEVFAHITEIKALLPEEPNPEWTPVEDRGGQITFSPIGNTAPVELKKTYDPDVSKRFEMLRQVPFESDTLVVKIGGSTSFDYFHRDSNKGTNVQKFIELKGWNKEDCIYYGDGLYPGGNDEAVIGIIDTEAVSSDEDTYQKLTEAYT